jgi:cell division protein FtsX
MSILYGFYILNSTTKQILCFYGETETIKKDIARFMGSEAFNKINDTRLTLDCDNNITFNIFIPNNIMYVIITSTTYIDNKINIDELYHELTQKIVLLNGTILNKKNKSHSELVDKYNNNTNKIKDLTKKIDNLQSLMQSNIVKILERGEKIEEIEASVEKLNKSSDEFNKNAKNIQKIIKCRNCKITTMIAIVIIIIVIIFFVIIFSF